MWVSSICARCLLWEGWYHKSKIQEHSNSGYRQPLTGCGTLQLAKAELSLMHSPQSGPGQSTIEGEYALRELCLSLDPRSDDRVSVWKGGLMQVGYVVRRCYKT